MFSRNRSAAIGWFDHWRLSAGHEYRVEDVRVRAATAEIPRQRRANFIEIGSGVAVQERLGRCDDAWRTETTLHGVELGHRNLKRIGIIDRADAFHRGDFSSGRIQRQHHAARHGAIINQHRASSARGSVADFFGARDIALFAEGFQQGRRGLGDVVEILTIDLERGSRGFGADDGRLPAVQGGVRIRRLPFSGSGRGGDSDRLQKEATRDISLPQ